MSTTAHGSADGQGASEEELRAALDALVDRSPHWNEPNRTAITTLGPAITELISLRAAVAAQRPVVAAVAAMHPLDDEMGYCLFCSVTREGQQHDADCPWVCALALAQSAHGSAPDAGEVTG